MNLTLPPVANSKVELKSALQCSFLLSPQYSSLLLFLSFPSFIFVCFFKGVLETPWRDSRCAVAQQTACLSLWLVETLQMMWWPSCFLLLHHGCVAWCLLSKGQNNVVAFSFAPFCPSFILSLLKQCYAALISQSYSGSLSTPVN